MIKKIIGMALFCWGFWFLGQNIFFTNRYSFFSFKTIEAAGSVISIVLGTLMLFNGGRNLRMPALVLIAAGIVLVLVSGFIVITPTSMAEVFLGFIAMALGIRLASGGDIDI
jgi:hypothetical protein